MTYELKVFRFGEMPFYVYLAGNQKSPMGSKPASLMELQGMHEVYSAICDEIQYSRLRAKIEDLNERFQTDSIALPGKMQNLKSYDKRVQSSLDSIMSASDKKS